MIPSRNTPARDLLDFYAETGVDALLGENPVDRFASTEPAEPAARSVQPVTPAADLDSVARAAPAAPPAPDEAVMQARPLQKTQRLSTNCAPFSINLKAARLKSTASQLVFADGNPEARVMLVGEAPGREEDIEGLPFVGRSGKLLDRMLAAIGLDRTSVYIANIVPWRPPGNRTPTPQESQICLPFILRQIEIADPDILVCLGGPSAQTLLGIKEGITKTRGRWFAFETGKREIRAMPTFHPAFLLRSPLQKRFAWRDFLAIKEALDQR